MRIKSCLWPGNNLNRNGLQQGQHNWTVPTRVDGSHEVLDLALLPVHERGRPGVRGGGRRRGQEVGVDGYPGGVVAPVLEAAEAVEEHLEDVAALPRDIVVEVGEDPAHPRPARGRELGEVSGSWFGEERRRSEVEDSEEEGVAEPAELEEERRKKAAYFVWRPAGLSPLSTFCRLVGCNC